MFLNRSFPASVLMASLVAAAVAAVVMPTDATAADLDCSKVKNKTVQKSCTDGNNTVKLMREQMKKWTEAAGDDYKCTTCHKKSSGGELKPGAEGKWGDFATAAGIK